MKMLTEKYEKFEEFCHSQECLGCKYGSIDVVDCIDAWGDDNGYKIEEKVTARNVNLGGEKCD